MLNSNQTKLSVFDNFRIDRQLPKYQKEEGEAKNQVEGMSRITWGSAEGNDLEVPTNSGVLIATPTSPEGWFPKTSGKIKTRWEKIKSSFVFNLFFGLFIYDKPKALEVFTKMTVQEFFRNIKMNATEIDKTEERMTGYITSIKHAKEFGQTALAEDLEDRLSIIRFETRMFSMDLTKVITEEQVVEFYKESEKGIRLDWIANFTRMIPAGLLSIKQRADELEIFDNYVIMHYDPQGKSFKETEAERQERLTKQRDPIMFGVIRNSRKLYYIGSWEDEFCDLTIEKFIEKFGEEAIKQNDLTINKF
jgi:hypothetical protein